MAGKRDTKLTLLETALELIWSSSYECVSVEDICREARAKKGSFYHYFGSKAELVAAALDSLWQNELEKELIQAFLPELPPTQRLKKAALFIYERQQREQQRCGRVIGCPFCSIGSEKCSEDGVLKERTGAILEQVHYYFQQTVSDGVQLGEIVPECRTLIGERLFAHYVGTLMLSRLQNSLHPLDDLYDAWAAIYQAGLNRRI